ncbi:MAG: hypothetical protein NTY98_17305 [Verrucomicrobia bacterium]|nr:hypothetical protein [Verrucomicrobiota bacterium]
MNDLSFLVESGFAVLAVIVAIVVAAATRSAWVSAGICVWVLLAALLAKSGVLLRFATVPPPIGLLILSGCALTLWLGFSSAGHRIASLPVSWLVGFQSFRIVVEILIHRSSTLGLAPPQMTWSGMNFDILTGVTALIIAPFASRVPRAMVFAWNTMGLGLLLWVVLVAALSFPTAFQVFHPDNIWVARFPYVWLPSVLVTAALLGHVVVFRKLLKTRAIL